MVNILNSDHLARLAYSEMHNEPILRRTIIDKSEKRVRHLMASILWDPKLTQWLHHVLIDHLSTSYLASYLDILQVCLCYYFLIAIYILYSIQVLLIRDFVFLKYQED